MQSPNPKPVMEHLSDWTRLELAEGADAVKAMLESDGWKAVERSIEDRLRFEQRMLMASSPSGDDDRYERTIGQWAGLRQARAIAEGVVRAGEQAEREMRDAA